MRNNSTKWLGNLLPSKLASVHVAFVRSKEAQNVGFMKRFNGRAQALGVLMENEKTLGTRLACREQTRARVKINPRVG